MEIRILWGLAIVAGVGALLAVIGALRAQKRDRHATEPGRQVIDAEGPRIGIREERPREVVPSVPEVGDSGMYIFGPSTPATRPPSQWTGDELQYLLAKPGEGEAPQRKVITPDGPLVLTRPPFKLRKSVMTHREREYARAIAVLMPSGFVMCPQVRLDALLTPTAPNDRPVDDWRNWRRRVRLRAVDFVICRLPNWSPVVALEIEPETKSALVQQRDRMIDEALTEVGLPLLRCSGKPVEDWAMIAPYVRQHATVASVAAETDAAPAPGDDSPQPA